MKNRKEFFMLLTRSRKGEMSGRKMVLNSAYQILSKYGDVYESFIPDSGNENNSENLFALRRPTNIDFIINFFRILFCGWSFNEGLFYSRVNQKKIKEIFKTYDFDYIYVDSIRMMPYFSYLKQRVKVILDYDDLYSIRYKKLLKYTDLGEEVFGFYDNFFIKKLFKIIRVFFKYLLKFESDRVGKREVFYSKISDKLIIISREEADILESRTGKTVFDIPMIVPNYQNEWIKKNHRIEDNKVICCLLGNYDYFPNKQTLYYIKNEIIPELKKNNIDIYIKIIGKSDNLNIYDFDENQFGFLGFIENLDEVISDSLFMLCPIISGSGIKTKIIEGMSLGIPIITNKKGIEGLPSDATKDILVANSVVEYVGYVKLLSNDENIGKRMSLRSYTLYQNYFSEEVIEKKWKKILN